MQDNFLFELNARITSLARAKDGLSLDIGELTENELLQLECLEVTGTYQQTPQSLALEDDKLQFETRRALWRYHLFKQVLKGTEEAYQSFISNQKNPITPEQFTVLSAELCALNEDSIAAIRASCFIARSRPANQIFSAITETDSEKTIPDSEEFLTAASKILDMHPELMPVAHDLNDHQRKLLHFCFWNYSHLRHIMYTEGGANMFINLKDRAFNEEAFNVWRWRWLTNLFGFNNGQKYYDADVHSILENVFSSIRLIFSSGGHSASHFRAPKPNELLLNYLKFRAHLAGLDSKSELTNHEVIFLGHIAAFGNRINIITHALGEEILQGYQYFNRLFPDNTLAEDYVEHFIPNVEKTPTFTPALLNSALAELSKPEYKEKLDKLTLSALSAATVYSCQVLALLYSRAMSYETIISCKEAANVGKISLHEWLDNRCELQVDIDEEHNIVVATMPAPTAAASASPS